MRSHAETYDAFINGRLGKDEWTHEAHLVTGWMALDQMPPEAALSHLRESIKTHNCGIGVENTAAMGYHETMTVYFLTAIHAVRAASPDELFGEPTVAGNAPLNHWSKERLMSSEARLGWLEPDLAPLPWLRVGA